MKNYFCWFFNKAHADLNETSGKEEGARLSFLLTAHQYFKERPLELFIPVVTVGMVVASCIGVSLVRHDTAHVISQQSVQSNYAKVIIHQINDINSQLQALQSSPQNPAELKNSLAKINTDLDSVQKSILSMKEDMDGQMNDLKKSVGSQPNMKQYLDTKDLPFKVITIDVIAQQPFASVNYDNHIQPMAVGDALAGWTLMQADFATATAEFQNAKNQYIKIMMEG